MKTNPSSGTSTGTPTMDPPSAVEDWESIQIPRNETPLPGSSLSHAPETSPGTENLVAWDEPPGADGYRAPKLQPSDEAAGEASLVEEGLDEAEDELRSLAVDQEPSEDADGDIS